MKKIIYIIFAISLLHQCVGAQWVLQSTGTNNSLYNIQFVNENTGWAIGENSIILKTNNGGVNWFFQQSNLATNRLLTGIDMLDENTGYIVGWFSTILKTTNGGVNWLVLREMPIGQGNSYNDVDFINEQTGWFCGFLGRVWKTNNGGLNWDSVTVGASAPLEDILFVNAQTGWVVGDVGFLRKTTNGGLNWFFQFFGTTSDYWYNSLCFIDENTGWVAGYNSIMFGTTDGGNNWDTLSLVNGICVDFINSQTGWTGSENGKIFKTTNGGYNWYEQTYPAGGGFVTDIYFVSDTVGYSTSVFQILKTTNSGGAYVNITNSSSEVPCEFSLKQNYPNPFNPNTTIEFEIQKKDDVRLVIYDILGREIQRLVETKLNAGKYSTQFDGSNFSSGIYFYTLYYTGGRITKKMILNK